MRGKDEKSNRSKPDERARAAEQVNLAKSAFMDMADSCHPLGFVQKRPAISLGTAALLGFTLNYLRPATTTLSFLSLVVEIMNLSNRLLKK